MTTPTYPKRPSHFAHKAVRAMVKTCVAQEHGQGVFALLCVIAHTEDARHYTSPVTFWNEQLAAVAGFANVKAMDRQRAKAVESGWLVYIPGAKAKPGKYWVSIPPQFSILDDAPTDEGDGDESAEVNTSPLSTSNLTNKVGRQPGKNRERTGKEPGSKWATFNPVPNPVPKTPHTPHEQERAGVGVVGVLTDVGRKDLATDDSLKALYRTAVDGGLIQDTDAMRLRFVAEAERVLADKSLRKPGAVFATNVRAGLVTQLSQADEDRGRLRMNRMRASKVNGAVAEAASKLGVPS
jgi:hypothetical protein